MHLEQALRHREIRRADLYRQFEQAAFSQPLPGVAVNEFDLSEDNCCPPVPAGPTTSILASSKPSYIRRCPSPSTSLGRARRRSSGRFSSWTRRGREPGPGRFPE
jgi:hypothetical protein